MAAPIPVLEVLAPCPALPSFERFHLSVLYIALLVQESMVRGGKLCQCLVIVGFFDLRRIEPRELCVC